MKNIFYGKTAFSQWLVYQGSATSIPRVNSSVMKDCAPTPESVAYLKANYPHVPAPFHLLVPNRSTWPVQDAVTHALSYSVSGSAFWRIDAGIYAVCPELCFVELARELPIHELIQAGGFLCASFAFDPKSPNGLTTRPPLTCKKSILRFLDHNAGIPGIQTARRALPFICEKAASPPEIFLHEILSLPYRLGGFQIPDLKTNLHVKPSKKAQRISARKILIPDLSHQSSRLAVEYDSNAEHMTSKQLTLDATKRLALEADGYKVVTITAKQLGSLEAMRQAAKQIAHHMGRRVKPQSKYFEENQRRLFNLTWKPVEYLRPGWLV